MTKSTHQLFKEYLLSEESLTPEQEGLLQAHVRECAECRQQEASWANVRRLFEDAPALAPAAGFTGRWQERAAAQRQKAQRQRSWIFFSATTSIAVALSALLVYLTLQEFISPLQILSRAVYFLVMLISYYREISGFMGSISVLVPIVSIAGVVFFTGFVSLLRVLWAVAYRKLSSLRRVNS